MVTYQFYITNVHEGLIQGTNDLDAAKELSYSDEFFVLDVGTNSVLVEGKFSYEVEEII